MVLSEFCVAYSEKEGERVLYERERERERERELFNIKKVERG